MSEPKLRRAIGLRTVISSGAGLAFAATSFPAVVQVGGGLAGGTAWVAILLAGLLSVPVAWVFAELVGMYPTAAGIKLYIEKAFGERAALVVGALYLLVSVGIAAADSYILARVMGATLPAVPGWVWVLGLVLPVTAVNLRGIRLSGLTQDITTYSQYAVLIGLSLWAVLRPGAPMIQMMPDSGSSMGILQAAALGIFLFMGWEWVMPLAEEVHDVRVIARGMVLTVGLLLFTYLLLNMGSGPAGPKPTAVASTTPHVLLAEALAGRAGVAAMLVVTLIATVTTFNAGVLTASRFLYAMARDHALPAVVSRLHPRHATPWVATLVLSGIALVIGLTVLWTDQFQVLIILGAAVECLVYAVMGGAVLRLRRLEPDLPRPFRMPGGTWVGWTVVVLFSALTVTVFLPDAAQPGPARWIALGAGLAATLLIMLYVSLVVPRLRARYAALAAQRQRRRPGRSGS